MSTHLPIGDFSRATHMTVKTLRHYHQIGLLEPAEVDARTGYRRYSGDQIPTAQVIRRFRELGMPLDAIRAVLVAPDLHTRNRQITAHLARLEDELTDRGRAIAALRDLLVPVAAEGPAGVELRTVAATGAAAITEIVDADAAVPWLQGALGELRATLAAQDIPAAGTAGGIYTDPLFTHHHGQVTAFVPCPAGVRQTGRVRSVVIPHAELAIAVHLGAPQEVDHTYGRLATYVASRAIAVDGPIREYYLVGQHNTPDTDQWRTEICWPIFQTTPSR